MSDLIKQVNLPIMRRDSLIDPSSINPTDRSFEIRWTTGARRITWSWEEGDWGGFIEEELDLAGADLSRLNNGAPYFKDHASWSIDNQLGVHVDGSAIVDLEQKEGRAKIRLSKNAWVDRYWNDIADKILRQTSVGYQVGTYLVIREEGRLPLYRAIQWTPLENSQVGIGADPGAQVRSAGSTPPKLFATNIQYQKRTVISITKERSKMGNKNKPQIPNQNKRAMSDDAKTSCKDILTKYAMPAENIDAATDEIAALWPAEGEAAAEPTSEEMTEAARALGVEGPVTLKKLTEAAKNLRALFDAQSKDLAEKAIEQEASEFDQNEKKGLHRNLDKVNAGFARSLYGSNLSLYRSEVAKVKPLTEEKPPKAAETRSTVRGVSDQADDLERRVLAKRDELMRLDPKLSEPDAYTQAFRSLQQQYQAAQKQ